MKQGIYRHYSGKLYQVLGVARHSETLEEMVIYQSLYEGYGLWARPKSMFIGTVEVSGTQQNRFAFVGEGTAVAPEIK